VGTRGHGHPVREDLVDVVPPWIGQHGVGGYDGGVPVRRVLRVGREFDGVVVAEYQSAADRQRFALLEVQQRQVAVRPRGAPSYSLRNE